MPITWNIRGTYTRNPSESNDMNLGIQTLLWQNANWAIINDLSLGRGQISNKLYNSTKWAITEQVDIGWTKKRTALFMTLAYSHNLALNLEHSDFYLNTIYPDAQDGWYKKVGGYFAPGLKYQRLFGENILVNLALSYPITTGGNPLTIIPAQAQIGVSFQW